MQRGGKKSPFLGRTERMESASQLLYPRYTALTDAVLYPEGSILPFSPTQTKSGTAVPAPQIASPAPAQAQPIVQFNTQPLFRTALQPTTASEIATPNDDAKPKKPKKKKQKIKEDPTAKISGPSNAEEAQLMRSVLGFAPAAPVSTPETPTPQPATMAQPTQAHVQQQPAVPQLAAQQAHQAQQAQHAQQAQQAQQPIVQQPVAQQQQQQQQQAAPIQPQQQSTFRFGFAAEQPTGTPPANGTSVASPAALAPSQEAPQAVAQPAGPSPAGAAEPATEFVARRVFVGGMPFTYEVDAIREYWGFCGEIEDLDVMRFPDTGRFKGIAFITYATEEGYNEALKCDGTDLDGQQLRVQKCMSAGQHGAKKKQAPMADAAALGQQQQQVQQQPAAPKVAGYHVAYVGNLAFEAGDEEVQGLFPDCNVTKVRLHTDKVTGKSRGFAHVHFLDEASLDRAMQFNGAPLHGRQVKVSYAQRKK